MAFKEICFTLYALKAFIILKKSKQFKSIALTASVIDVPSCTFVLT